MKFFIYQAGKAFQITALVALPSSIWVGHFGRDEKGAIVIFIVSILIFMAGYCLTRFSARL